MATVLGVTAARAQEIEDNSVVSAKLSGNNLVLITHDGTQINVGRVIAQPYLMWPVNSIFMNTSPTNPNTLLQGGTWVRWGKGRVAVSLDEGQTEFSTTEKTGGAKTHLLTGDESGIQETNMVRQVNGGNMYFNTPGDGDSTHRATLVGPAPAKTAHNNLQPYITVYMWKRTA